MLISCDLIIEFCEVVVQTETLFCDVFSIQGGLYVYFDTVNYG